MSDKVRIINKVNHNVTVTMPDIRFHRMWPKYGSKIDVSRETLEELMNDIGFENMIRMGILYIEDLEVKKDLGLEPEDATEPVNIIVLDDQEKRRYLTTLSLVGFKEKIAKLSRVQLEELCDYAIDNQLVDMEKCKVLKDACGKDIFKAIQLLALDKED